MKYFLLFVLVMNVVTFTAFGIDKLKAVKGKWRISESTLLLLSMCFGSVGQLAGMKVFHHKTHKWYFWLMGIISFILHFGILYILLTKSIM